MVQKQSATENEIEIQTIKYMKKIRRNKRVNTHTRTHIHIVHDREWNLKGNGNEIWIFTRLSQLLKLRERLILKWRCGWGWEWDGDGDGDGDGEGEGMAMVLID